MTITTISVEKLKLSPDNVRKSFSKSGIDEMKASIIAHGLLDNLIVSEADDGMFEVVGGGRRLVAMQALIKEGSLAKGHAVPCLIVDAKNAAELSLAENTVREEMHPADEFEAFNRLATVDKLPPEKIAQRFGKTEKHVLQRLKLARVAPEILKDYRAGKLKLDAVMAFTLTDDQNSQRKVYKGVKDYPQAHNIRRLLTEKKISTKSKLAAFVGLEAYEKAGGKFVSDLFGDESFLEDGALVQQLAADKLKAEAEKVKAEGWAWVESELEDNHYSFTSKYDQIEPEPVDAPKKLTDKLAKLQADYDKAEGQFHETDDEDLEEKLRDKIDALEKEITVVEAELETYNKYDPEQMKTAGAYVYVDHRGKSEIERGLVSRQQAKQSAAKANGETAKPKEKGISQSLLDSLKQQRLQIAQAALASNPDVAFDLLVFKAACDKFTSAYLRSGPEVSFSRNHFRTDMVPDAKATVAGKELVSVHSKLKLGWMKEKTDSAKFEAFIELSHPQKLEILAYCVSGTLQPQLAEKNAFELALGMTETDLTEYWRPTADNYLGKLTKDQLLKIGAEIFDTAWAKRHSDQKKGDLVILLDGVFANPDKISNPLLTDEQKKAATAKAKTWLPEGMAFTLPEKKTAKAKKKAA